MLPACAWLARRRRALGAATGPLPTMAVAWWCERGQQVASFAPPAERAPILPIQQQQREYRRHLSSLTSERAETAAGTAGAAATQQRAIGSGSGGSDAPSSSQLNLQAELAALNRELADVFGEPAPDGPNGGIGTSTTSSTTFAPPPQRPPPPRASPSPSADAPLSHVEPRTGRASMVDVSAKSSTLREARASCLVRLSKRAAAAVAANALKKGDVLGTARLAGVMAAKKTSDLIPLCHPLLLSRADVTAELVTTGGTTTATTMGEGTDEDEGEEEEEEEDAATCSSSAVRVACVARVGGGATGVEMEALTGAAVAALTVYDMVKAVGKGAAVVTDLRLDYKVGGKSGAWARPGFEAEDPQGAALLRLAAAEAQQAGGGGG